LKKSKAYIGLLDTGVGDYMLEDYLIPGEEVVWTGPEILMANNRFSAYITNKRFVLYRVRGAIMKKEDFIGEKLKNIQNIRYREEGLISKKGILTVEMQNRKLALEGPTSAVKSTYQALMQFWEEQ